RTPSCIPHLPCYIPRPAVFAGKIASNPTKARILQGECMKWRAFLTAAAVSGTLAGCMHEPAYVGDGFKPINANDGVARTTRSQKPEREPAKAAPPKSLLDMPPERPGDPDVIRVCASIRAVVNGKAILDEEVRQGCFAAARKAVAESTSAEERAA